MGTRFLILLAVGAALGACSVSTHTVEQKPAAVAVAPAATSTVVYTDPAPVPAVTTVYTR